MREGIYENGDPCPACRRPLEYADGLWCSGCGSFAESDAFQPPEVSLYALRKEGWRVGAHGEYENAAGEWRVFWILVRGTELVRGEGRDDAEALDQVRARIHVPPVLPDHPAVAGPTAPLTREQHMVRHKDLHTMLDELLADFILHHPRARPSQLLLMELMEWSARQTTEPTELR